MDPLTEPFVDLCRALRSMRGQVQELVKVHESIDAFNAAFGAFQTAMALHASCLEFPAPQKKVSIHLLSGIPAPQLSLSGIPSLSNKRLSRDSAGSSSSLKLGTTTTMGRTGPTKGRSSTGSKGGKASLTGGVGGAQKKASATGKTTLQKRKHAASNKRQESPAWKWDKRTFAVLVLCLPVYECADVDCVRRVDIRDQIPRKYQSNEELKKLENILLYMKNRRSGMYVESSLRNQRLESRVMVYQVRLTLGFLLHYYESTIADLVKHSGLAVIKSKEILQTLMKVDLIHREHEKSVGVHALRLQLCTFQTQIAFPDSHLLAYVVVVQGFVYTFGSAP
ncbi:Trifunctional nucleotide phosphoesterase protein yfkn, partial [Globisporangium splendens]